MVRILLFALFGGLLFLLGGIFFLIQVLNLLHDPYPWLISIGAVFCMLVGGFVLLRSKLSHIHLAKQTMPENTQPNHTHMSLIEKQHLLSEEWDETTTKRDKLKMLKMASAAEDMPQG